jgi:excisionase family DNA binding protein
MAILSRQNPPVDSLIAPAQEVQSIKEIERILKPQGFQPKLVGANGEEITLPDSIYQVLRKVVDAMVSGKVISIAFQDQQMTTQQAADLLNVSRPHLIKLLEQGEIPYIRVGTHRRVCFEDLMTYKQQRDIKRREGLKQLTQFLQNEGFYDEESSQLDK